MSILLSIFGVVFAFGLVIFVHEFGHFIVAKKSGVKVERFSFGLGPEMVGFQWGETRYCIAWLPLGGEVRMAGEYEPGAEPETPSSADPLAAAAPAPDRSREFFGQPWYRRILIAFAGPFMNYALAAFIFFAMLVAWGEPVRVNETEIGAVVSGMPAEKAGLKVGDKILKVQDEKVDDFVSIASKIFVRTDQETTLSVVRAGQPLEIKVTPQRDPRRNGGVIGIRPATPVIEHHPVTVAKAVGQSFDQCWNITYFTVYYLAQKIWSRQISKADVAGPLGISQVIANAVKTGAEDFFRLIALISVSIGLFNLFPIPLLDGGHVVYYVIEGLRGRPLSQKIIGRANMVGLALLLTLLAFATMNDVQRLRSEKSAAADKPAAVAPNK